MSNEGPIGRAKERWTALTLYERFEDAVALLLALTIAVVVATALFHLLVDIFGLVRSDAFDPENQEVFHRVFGMVMTLLIALELKHTILSIARRGSHVVQVQTVILVALIAIARKFIILDFATTSPVKVAALALVVLALGASLWFLRGMYPDAPRGETAA
jgi:uncharacterized membrane protein (DUF373 family)